MKRWHLSENSSWWGKGGGEVVEDIDVMKMRIE